MNFLAHLYLSFSKEELLMGNFAGDFMSNKEVRKLPMPYQYGVELHRLIDSFTDNHAEVRKCTTLLHASQGKYAPVVVDIFFDHILYNNWSEITEYNFVEFKSRSYNTILKHHAVFPEKASKRVVSMVNGDFLESYTSIEGLTFTFHRLERRLRFPSNLAFATEDLKNNYDFFNECFHQFFPEVKQLAKQYIDTLDESLD